MESLISPKMSKDVLGPVVNKGWSCFSFVLELVSINLLERKKLIFQEIQVTANFLNQAPGTQKRQRQKNG